MFARTLSSALVFLSLAFNAVAEFDLSPVSADDMDMLLGKPSKRAAFNEVEAVQLMSEEHVYWAGRSQTKLLYADMTLRFPESTRSFVSMDKFRPMIDRVTCGQNMNIEFKSTAGLRMAQAAWEWIGDDDHEMVLLATWPGCGPSGRRNPYVVKGIKFDAEKKMAHLKTDLKEWSEIASSYHLKVSHAPLPKTQSLAIRDDPDFSFDVTSNFNQEFFNHTLGGWYIALACTACGTEGRFNVELEYSMWFWDIDSFSVSIQPEDVAAFMAVYGSVGIGGVPKVGYGWRANILSIPLSPWSPIPGLIELGPYAAIDVGFKIGKVSGGMEFATGARMDLSNDAIASFGLFDSDADHFSGWEPSFYQAPVSVNAHVTAHSEIYTILAAQLRADIRTGLGSDDKLGYIASFDLKLPYIGADVTATTRQEGSTCPGAEGKDSVSVTANMGVELAVQASEADDMGNPLLSFSLYNTHTQLWSSCWGIGRRQTSAFQNITALPEPTGTLPPQDAPARIDAMVTPAAVKRSPQIVDVKRRSVRW